MKNRDRANLSEKSRVESGCSERVDFMPQCRSSNCAQTVFYCKLILKRDEWRNILRCVYFGGLTFINPFSGRAPQRWADPPALTLPWPTVAALQPVTRRQEAVNDSKPGPGQHSTNMCFQTSMGSRSDP